MFVISNVKFTQRDYLNLVKVKEKVVIMNINILRYILYTLNICVQSVGNECILCKLH